MGTVVDGRLKVNGVNRLRIVDASVFPAPVSGALQASVYATAELASDLILGDIRKGAGDAVEAVTPAELVAEMADAVRGAVSTSLSLGT